MANAVPLEMHMLSVTTTNSESEGDTTESQKPVCGDSSATESETPGVLSRVQTSPIPTPQPHQQRVQQTTGKDASVGAQSPPPTASEGQRQRIPPSSGNGSEPHQRARKKRRSSGVEQCRKRRRISSSSDDDSEGSGCVKQAPLKYTLQATRKASWLKRLVCEPHTSSGDPIFLARGGVQLGVVVPDVGVIPRRCWDTWRRARGNRMCALSS